VQQCFADKSTDFNKLTNEYVSVIQINAKTEKIILLFFLVVFWSPLWFIHEFFCFKNCYILYNVII